MFNLFFSVPVSVFLFPLTNQLIPLHTAIPSPAHHSFLLCIPSWLFHESVLPIFTHPSESLSPLNLTYTCLPTPTAPSFFFLFLEQCVWASLMSAQVINPSSSHLINYSISGLPFGASKSERMGGKRERWWMHYAQKIGGRNKVKA